VPEGPPGAPGQFVWENGAFPRGDAVAYYGLVRHLRPRRVVEVGAGWSSLVLRRALAANDERCDVTLIEPRPNMEVLGELPAGWKLVDTLVQFAGLADFEALEPGDVLFYDGSHCVHTGSDVNWIFFEVLPRLRPGVWIHVHDIGWPWDYGPEWVLDEGLSWNEQYLVQAFLMNNDAYRVRLAANMLRVLRPDEVAELLPLPGSSVWIEKLMSSRH
jgi:Methyltransferase domain